MRVVRGTAQRSRRRPSRRRIQGFRRPARAFSALIPTPGETITQLLSVNSTSKIGVWEASVADFAVFADLYGVGSTSSFGSPTIQQRVTLTGIPAPTDPQFGGIEVEMGLPQAEETQLSSVVNTESAIGSISVVGADGSPAGAQWHEAMAMVIRSMFYADGYGVPTVWENHTMCIEPAPDLWVRFSVATSEDEVQVTLGPSAHYRFAGVATAQVFSRIARGDQDAKVLADRICNKFRGRAEPGIYFRSPTIFSLGREGMWYRLNVSLPFVAERFIRAATA